MKEDIDFLQKNLISWSSDDSSREIIKKRKELKSQLKREQIKINILTFFYRIVHPRKYKKMMKEMNEIIDASKEWL